MSGVFHSLVELVVGAGFEPAKAVLADLQSAPFGQLGNPTVFGDPSGIRTRVASVKGWCVRPLHYGAISLIGQKRLVPLGNESSLSASKKTYRVRAILH